MHIEAEDCEICMTAFSNSFKVHEFRFSHQLPLRVILLFVPSLHVAFPLSF